MPIRRFNSTGRVKILREDSHIYLIAHDSGFSFEATLQLSDYGLPAESEVFVEAYRQTTFMRFPFGTVVSPGAQTSTRLTEFSTPEGILFRVKVTSVGNRPGVLLAEGDKIPTANDIEQPDHRVPLLPPMAGNLGQEVWRVEISGESGPYLMVNERVGDWKAVAALPIFRSLVYPAAMREVLWKIYKVEGTKDIEDLGDWRCRWLAFASSLPGAGDPPLASDDDEEWKNWIDNAAESFCRNHQFHDHFRTQLDEIQK